jgi:formate/nitrite transporter FocA (FNT family)
MGYHLITGRICTSLGRENSELLIIPACVAANLAGCFVIGWTLRTFLPKLVDKVLPLCLARLEQAPLQTVFLGILCGIMMFVAVVTFQKQEGVARYLGIIFGIPTFILCGFEHSVADAIYFFTSGLPFGDWAGYVLLVLIGNMIGGMLFPALMMINDLFVNKKKTIQV